MEDIARDVEFPKKCTTRAMLLQNKSHEAQVMEAETLTALYSPLFGESSSSFWRRKEEEHFDATNQRRRWTTETISGESCCFKLEQNRAERKRNEKERTRRMERIRMFVRRVVDERRSRW